MSSQQASNVIEFRAGAPTVELPRTRAIPSAMRVDLARRLIERLQARVRFAVRGDSMHPALRSGDRVTLGPLPGRPAQGDLVAVRTTEGLVIHRYVASPSDGVIVTAGDNADGPDAPLPETALVGVVETIERRGRIVGCGSLAPGSVAGITRRLVKGTREALRRFRR